LLLIVYSKIVDTGFRFKRAIVGEEGAQ
jgi:hypothetical protein